MATVSDKARKRLEKLRQGYPLSSGKVISKPHGKEVDKKTKASAKDMSQVEERLRAERAGGMRRGKR